MLLPGGGADKFSFLAFLKMELRSVGEGLLWTKLRASQFVIRKIHREWEGYHLLPLFKCYSLQYLPPKHPGDRRLFPSHTWVNTELGRRSIHSSGSGPKKGTTLPDSHREGASDPRVELGSRYQSSVLYTGHYWDCLKTCVEGLDGNNPAMWSRVSRMEQSSKLVLKVGLEMGLGFNTRLVFQRGCQKSLLPNGRGFPGGTSGKEPACRGRRHETWVWSLGGKIPWRRAWQPTPKSHGQRSLMGYSPWGHKESDRA